MNFGGQHAYGGNPDTNTLHNTPSNLPGNVSPYYATINHGGTYQIYHPLQSIPSSVSPPPHPQSAVNISPPTSSTGPTYSNVGNAALTNYNYGSSWHPGEYFQNAYHYQATSSDYVPVIGDIEWVPTDGRDFKRLQKLRQYSFSSSPYGSVPAHSTHGLSHHHHHHLNTAGSVPLVADHLQHQMSTSPTSENTITVLESGPSRGGGGGELKKMYSHHHDLNNNGHLYQNLTPVLANNNVKAESHSPDDGTNRVLSPNESKINESGGVHLSNNELNPNADVSNDRPRCWTKI